MYFSESWAFDNAVFHVKHRQIAGHEILVWGERRPRDEQLATQPGTRTQYVFQVAGVELRRQVVEEKDGRHGLFRKSPGLGQDERGSDDFLFTPGKAVTGQAPVASYYKVRPVRAHGRETSFEITSEVVGERFLYGLFAPARVVTELNAGQLGGQLLHQAPYFAYQGFEVRSTVAVDDLREGYELGVQALDHRRVSDAKSRIALPQGPVKPPPVFEKRMFHVKHAPVAKAATNFRTSADQQVAVRFHENDGQVRSEIAQLRGIRPVDSSAPVTVRTFEADAAAHTARLFDLCKDSVEGVLGPDEGSGGTGPE